MFWRGFRDAYFTLLIGGVIGARGGGSTRIGGDGGGLPPAAIEKTASETSETRTTPFWTNSTRIFAELVRVFVAVHCLSISYFLYSKISPGWHSNALQIASKVEKRTALALPFFSTEIFAIVMPTFSASSVTLIFRFANMTSMVMMIAMLVSLDG